MNIKTRKQLRVLLFCLNVYMTSYFLPGNHNGKNFSCSFLFEDPGTFKKGGPSSGNIIDQQDGFSLKIMLMDLGIDSEGISEVVQSFRIFFYFHLWLSGPFPHEPFFRNGNLIINSQMFAYVDC